jgi:ATP-dependent exoDNAse (exonuclease V) alpha subunit
VRRNDHDLDLQNGTLVQVHPTQAGDGLHVETLDGRHLRITNEGTLGSLEYGYASTVHRAQGATVDVGLVYATDKLFRQLAYVALSRGRLDNRLYATSRQVERITERAQERAETPVEAWEQATRRDRSKRHALDEALTEPAARPMEATHPPPEVEPPGLELGR